MGFQLGGSGGCVGRVVSAAPKRWLSLVGLQFQPSEITKLVVVIAVAGYCHQHRNDLDTRRLVVGIAISGFVASRLRWQRER